MADWRSGVLQAIKAAGVTQVAYAPDAGRSRPVERSMEDNDLRAAPLAAEEEGVALLQSSDAGNCIDMLSLARTRACLLAMLATMRGK